MIIINTNNLPILHQNGFRVSIKKIYYLLHQKPTMLCSLACIQFTCIHLFYQLTQAVELDLTQSLLPYTYCLNNQVTHMYTRKLKTSQRTYHCWFLMKQVLYFFDTDSNIILVQYMQEELKFWVDEIERFKGRQNVTYGLFKEVTINLLLQ